MPLEIEAKMKLPDLEPVRTALRQAGAAEIGTVMETNIFFDTPDGSLARQDRGLRLRVSQPLPAGAPKAVITHKGPRQQGLLKTRQENELLVTSPDDAAALLQAMGFHPVLHFQKRRQSWRLDNCQVELDELPQLGTYVEIEGDSDQSVQRVRQRLGLGAVPLVGEGYASLLFAWLRRNHVEDRVVEFP